MRARFGNCARARELSIWPLMRTRTAVARKRRNRLPAGSQSKACMFAESRCPMVTIRTASLFRAAMRVSSGRYWRRLNDDLPRGP